uniref:Uncharacterized protein n=1 Tax=Avena sativa TaxID=4498 RepID=A0ACD5U9H4_AVESA
MATSKEPLNPSRDRATKMAPNLRPSSSESSGYSARRARSVTSSPDRKFGPSAAAAAAVAAAKAPSAAPDMSRPSLSHAGHSISSRTVSSSGSSSINGRRPSSGSAAKATLSRAKSEKVTVNSQRPPALAVPLSSSFRDMAKTVAAAKSASTLLKNKLSPKPSLQRVPSSGPVRGGKPLPVSSARAPGPVAKKREAANGGATASSRPKGTPPKRAVEPSASRQEKDDELSMQFEDSESLITPSIEDQLREELPDPVDLKSRVLAASGSTRHDLQEPYSQQQGNNVEEVKEHSGKEDAGGGELRNGGRGADASGQSKPDIAKVADELDRDEMEEAQTKAAAQANRTEVAQSWRKDDPKSNDVIEETKSKLLEERKSRVKALVGAFETVMSFKE